MYVRYKDPVAIKWFGFDGSLYLNDGEVFTNLTTIDPPGIIVDQKAPALNGTAVVARVQGGQEHQVYPLAFIFETSEGRTDKKTILIRMRNE
jgi:hypothetical protein